MTSTATSTPDLPDWRDESFGTRVRVALWLADKVGQGGTFTSQELRAAMPGVEQIDRRMRDLRPAGWVIHTYRDRPGLKRDELLLDSIGLPVWEKEHRAAGIRVITARIRQQTFERDGYRCIRCGVLAGESYPDDPATTARLTVGHVTPHKHQAAGSPEYVTECARCNEAVKHLTATLPSVEAVWDRAAELRKPDKIKLLAWLVQGRREPTAVERAASMIFQLPAEAREEIKTRLAAVVGDDQP
jgi:hypothetical protein